MFVSPVNCNAFPLGLPEEFFTRESMVLVIFFCSRNIDITWLHIAEITPLIRINFPAWVKEAAPHAEILLVILSQRKLKPFV